MNTEHTQHPCETVDASADVMKLAEMILSDCGCSTAISDRLQRRVAGRIQLHMDSALGGQQQAEPVAWHTNDPCVSSEHIEAIAKVCKIIPSYTTVEYVARIVGFGHVLLADKSVQEAFVRANSHLLRTDAAQPPAVAVPLALPEWMECDAKVQAGTANALERFIAANEPAGDSAAEFRAALLAILAAAPQAAPLSAALADIAAERRRQIEQERWTADRDDRLFNGQLATAAGYYALAAGWPHERDIGRGLKPQYWPFNQEWWKPTTARHNLVKAGALITAEIERLDRAAQKGGAA